MCNWIIKECSITVKGVESVAHHDACSKIKRTRQSWDDLSCDIYCVPHNKRYFFLLGGKKNKTNLQNPISTRKRQFLVLIASMQNVLQSHHWDLPYGFGKEFKTFIFWFHQDVGHIFKSNEIHQTIDNQRKKT